ncbi:MAG: SDR family oxidoreductase [Thermoplasmata archaeon]|nr:SDR family oxidoreductase [Thermoplasmata archaeon]
MGSRPSLTPRPVALVTGASRGLGEVLSRFLAGQGFDLIVTARDGATLATAAKRFALPGVTVVGIPGDVADPAQRERLAEAAQQLGRLDLLVNNASSLGPSPLPPLSKYPLGSLLEVLETNLVAPLGLVQATLPLLRANRGLVVNISSDAAVAGYPGWGGYGASKAALDLVSLTLAHELREVHVAVVSVDPGDLRTRLHQEAFPGEDISDRPTPDVTLPFWAWLLGQDPLAATGGRYRAQSDQWQVPA